MITIQQAIYGENSGHALLAKSGSKSDIFNRISGYTDLNDRPAGGVLGQPIIKGTFIENHYILIKIFPDFSPGMRPGRVFSHALILDRDNFLKVNNICDLFQFHLATIDKEVSLDPITYENPLINSILPKINVRESSAINALTTLDKSNTCVVWLGEDGYWDWIARIWSNLPKQSRIESRIGAAFNPQNVQEENLNLIFIPSELSTSWSKYDYKIIDLTANEKISSSVAFMLAGVESSDSMISKLLDDFELEMNSIQDLSRLESIGKVYVDTNPALNRLLVFSNFVSENNPRSKSGTKGKQSLLNTIVKVIPNSSVQMVQALQYQTWKGFENSKSQVERAVQSWLDTNLLVKKDAESKGNLVYDVLSETDNPNWWHVTIRNWLLETLKEWKGTFAKPIWNWISNNNNLIPYLFPILPNSAEPNLTDEVSVIGLKSAGQILVSASQRNWLILHGIVAIKHFKPIEAFSKQLTIDNDHRHFEALSMMSKHVLPKDVIEITLSLDDDRLYKISGQLIKKQFSLLNKLDVTQSSWQKLWITAVEEGAELWEGITNPTETLYALLDQVLKEGVDNKALLAEIANSVNNDLTNYENRKSIWDHLPNKVRAYFLTGTSRVIFEQFLLGSISLSGIEKPILDVIVSDRFITDFLAGNSADISRIIKVYEELPQLKDSFLADYITNYPKSISEVEALSLGNLVSNNGLKDSAKSIYEKSRFIDSFKLAYEKCNSLVDHGLFDFITRQYGYYSKSEFKNFSILNILVITATDTETSAVLNKAREMFSIDAEVSMQGDHAVSLLGTLNSFRIWHAQCEAGSGGPSGSQAIVTDLILELSPKYVLMPGIAFGLNQEKEEIGDILVSTHVCSYEKQRVGKTETINRGEKVPSSSSLLSALRTVKQKWKKANMHFGIIMSGEKLVDNAELVAQLKRIEPESLGGEMEGAGLYAAAHRKKVDWILFKSIVDWGMGKTDEYQSNSSLYATEVLFEALKVITK